VPSRIYILLILALASLAASAAAPRPWIALEEDDPTWRLPADSALTLLRSQLEDLRREQGEHSRFFAAQQFRLGDAYRFFNQADSALRFLQACSTLCSQTPRAQDSLALLCNFSLAATYDALGRYSILQAEPGLAAALDSCRHCTWCDSLRYAKILFQWGRTTGRKDASVFSDAVQRNALRAEITALGILERHDRADSANVRLGLWWLHNGMREVMRPDEAAKYSRRLLSIAAAQPDDGFPTYAMVLQMRAEDLFAAGEPAEALALYRQSLPGIEAEFGPHGCQTARGYTWLAECLTALGRFDEAAPMYTRAISLWKDCGEYNPPYFYVSTLTELGRTYMERGNLTAADSLLSKAYEVAVDGLQSGEDAFSYLVLDLARLYDLQGDKDKAERYYWAALVKAEIIHPKADPRLSGFYEPFAEFLYETGRGDMARYFQQRALWLRYGIYGNMHPDVAESCQRMAWMQRDVRPDGIFTDPQNDLNPLRQEGRAWSIRQTVMRDAVSVLSERYVLSLARELQDEAARFYTLASEAFPDSAAVHDLASTVFGTKAQAWDVLSARLKTANEQRDATLAAITDSLLAVRTLLANVYVRAQASADGEPLVPYLDSLSRREQRWQDSLAARSPRDHGNDPLWNCTPSQVASALPANAVLVEFVKYDHRLSLRKSEPRYLVITVSPDSTITATRLGAAAPIEELIARWREEMANPVALDEFEYKKVARALYDRLWKPVAAACRGKDLVFIAPDGDIHTLAFAALVNSQGRYLVDSHAFHYLSSGRDLVRAAASTPDSAASCGLLVMGDPDYDAAAPERFASIATPAEASGVAPPNIRSECRAFRDIHWKRLPGTAAECAAILDLWPSEDKSGAQLLTGAAATEDAFKRRAPFAQTVYLATHGFWIHGNCIAPRTQGIPGKLRDFSEENPLLTSGLALAGANLKGADRDSLGMDDGILTAEEVAALDLCRVHLVVLSACETGVGKIVPGEGVFALRRAFELAGARTVLSSLWRVDDRWTAELMSAMTFGPERNIPSALRNAMLKQRQKMRQTGFSDHPYYWAGFVASGDWRVSAGH
jgi:CHAT domain-containing protein/tetratricopeptide (TPR) repeat protein